MDLLGSILGSMEKPPSMNDDQKKKAKAEKARAEKLRLQEKEKLAKFRQQIQKQINDFLKDASQQSYKFDVMDAVYRAIVHEVVDVAGLTSFSFGIDEQDRYVMVWKKEFAPSDEELLAYRRGEEWDPEKAKEIVRERERQKELQKLKPVKAAGAVPQGNYQNKYEHILGKESAKDAAKLTTANKSYGFVPSENKRDLRTIEQVMAESKAKRLKVEHESSGNTDDTGHECSGKSSSKDSSDQVDS